jgi:hypothetical protein
MSDNKDHPAERRSKEDRRKALLLRSVYKWNFDPLGRWWEERRSGKQRRQKPVSEDETGS